MANIFVGFHDRKSSSRILKPPGGGTSDIFNTSVTEPVSPKVKSASSEVIQETTPVSTPIKEELLCPINGTDIKTVVDTVETEIYHHNGDTVADSVKIPKIEALSMIEENQKEEVQVNSGETKNETVEVTTTKSENVSSLIHEHQHKEVKETKVITPERKIGQRVPPGGYSSGLW